MKLGELKELLSKIEADDNTEVTFKMDIYSANSVEDIEIGESTFSKNKYIQLELL